MKQPKLENITPEQAQRFVEEDMARYQSFGYEDKAMLIFHETGYIYHKRKHQEDYEKIGRMRR